MPNASHRVKLAPRLLPFNACVAEPIPRRKVPTIPAAKAAMDAEWARLNKKQVWDLSTVQEWSAVAARARREGTEVAFGYVFGICVLKNAELREDHPARKYKGRVVFQGNRVVN